MAQKDKVFGWAFIGCGAIANTVASEITKSGRHKVVSVYSRTKSRAEQFGIKYGAIACDTLADALSCEDVQGVYIATPHSAHYQNMLDSLKFKKPILCEKSFTINKAQTQAVLTLADKQKTLLTEAMWTRYNPLIVELRRIISSGELGKILSIKAAFCVPLWASRPFVSERVYKKEYGGGALLDLGVYPVSFCQMLLGSPSSIEVEGKLKNGIDTDNIITLGYKGQGLSTVCTLYASLERLRSYTAKIVCEKGIVTLPMYYRPSKMKIQKSGQKTITQKTKSGYIYEFDTVAWAIAEGKTEMTQMTPADTVRVMEILDEIRAKLGHKYSNEIEKI